MQVCSAIQAIVLDRLWAMEEARTVLYLLSVYIAMKLSRCLRNLAYFELFHARNLSESRRMHTLNPSEYLGK